LVAVSFIQKIAIRYWQICLFGHVKVRILQRVSLTHLQGNRWVHIRSSPMLSDQGKILGHVGTLEDITESKQAESERGRFIREQEARQQAEAANRKR